MCELFGINSSKRVEINSYLKEFFSHSEKHNYGWGLASFYGDSVQLEKEPIRANGSHYLNQRLKHPIVIDNAIAHIRLATVGSMVYENCHPFVKHDNYGGCWTLAHNGTIFDFPYLDKFKPLQEGQTDSERILLYIIDVVNVAQQRVQRKLSFDEKFDLLSNLLKSLSVGNKINLLIWDGEVLYVHYNYADTLYMKSLDCNTKIFSTQPLQANNQWQPVEFLKLLAYKDGNQIARSKISTTEYYSPERDWEYKNLDYYFL